MRQKKLLIVLVSTALFPWLFYDHYIGLNLFLFNVFVIIGLYLSKKSDLKSRLNRCVLAGSFLTALFVVYNGSEMAIAVNMLSLFLLAGTSLFPKGKNLVYISLISVVNFFESQYQLTVQLKSSMRGMNKYKLFRVLKMAILPLAVVFLFMLIYKEANPVFEGLVKSFFDVMDNFFTWLSGYIEFGLVLTILLGLILSDYFFLGKPNKFITEQDEKSSDQLYRKRKKSSYKYKPYALRNEYKSAIVLFLLLNLLILVVNLIDIWWVWFHFEWNGEYLKQFVHEGTYLLILSILISLGISIFYFRGSINFLRNNKPLKYLAYAWLLQNAILTISVGIRNFWYIHYFSLAYLRIGVIFFLILTLFSIYTVYIKIRDRKTTSFLFRKNAMAAYVLLVVMAFFNWDVLIAKYNFSHAKTAFVHFDFLAGLSNKALPYLEKSSEELKEIDEFQQKRFPFREQYMTSDEYVHKIEEKKELFLQNWPGRTWQGWNFSGERTYRKLTE